MSIVCLTLGVVGTGLSWILLEYFGRRTIELVGLLTLTSLQILVGVLDCMPNYDEERGLAWAQAILLLMWILGYGLSLGPVCFVISCEVTATRLRSKTLAVATAVQAVVGIPMTVCVPFLINPDQADARGKAGFVFGGLSLLCLVWAYFRVPETRGRTFHELDVMFENNVKARDFKGHIICT